VSPDTSLFTWIPRRGCLVSATRVRLLTRFSVLLVTSFFLDAVVYVLVKKEMDRKAGRVDSLHCNCSFSSEESVKPSPPE